MLISKDRAKRIAKQELADHPTHLLKRFSVWILDEASKGNFSGNFSTDGVHFTQPELEFLKDQGWDKLVWNSACLWYEVDWS